MKNEIKSNRLTIQVELNNNFQSHNKKRSRKKVGSLDCVSGDSEKTKLLRVISRKPRESKACVDTKNQWISSMDRAPSNNTLSAESCSWEFFHLTLGLETLVKKVQVEGI